MVNTNKILAEKMKEKLISFKGKTTAIGQLMKLSGFIEYINLVMDEISCHRTVPQAIIAFLEPIDFEDAIRNAVSCSLLKNIFLETLIKN